MLVLSHHKCGTVATLHLLREFAELNSLEFYASYWGGQVPPPNTDVVFLTNASYGPIYPHIGASAVHIIRNPLNIVQSAYYSHLKTHSLDGWPELVRQRQLLANASREEGMFLTFAFCDSDSILSGTPGPLCALRNWNFDDRRIVTLRLEDISHRMDCVLEALGASRSDMEFPDSRRYRFESLSGGRRVGEIDAGSHYRTGDPDAWREELPDALVAYMRLRFRNVLERFYPEALE
jgi:hypothetical protein